jgi:hypothetical protein
MVVTSGHTSANGNPRSNVKLLKISGLLNDRIVDFRNFAEFRNYAFWDSAKVFKCHLMGDPQF